MNKIKNKKILIIIILFIIVGILIYFLKKKPSQKYCDSGLITDDFRNIFFWKKI